jgi:predicted dienelactone hydrolase
MSGRLIMSLAWQDGPVGSRPAGRPDAGRGGVGVSAERRRRLRLRRILAGVAVFVLVIVTVTGGYVGYIALRQAQPVTLPAPTGPYPVGRTMFDWTDPARTDPLAPHPATARELSVWLWYPAARAAGSRAPYTPKPWDRLHLSGVAGLGETSFDKVRAHATDSPPAAPGRFPIVVWEPGLGFAAAQYTAIAENLASHGYLVAGVTPTYSANLTVLHQQVVHASPAGNPRAFDSADLHAGPAQQAGDHLVTVWAADARFSAAQVAALDHAGPLAGHVDGAHITYAGHSFGGAAALQACHDDPACVAAVNLDGTQYGNVVHSGLRQPMLTMATDSCVTGSCHPTGAADRSDEATAHALLAASTGPVWNYHVTGMRHFDFTDYDAYYLAAPLRHLLPLGALPRSRGLAITNGYLAAFLARAVHGRPAPLLDGTDPGYPEVHPQTGHT